MPRIYLTTEQAAEILQISPSTLQNWRYRREGPPCMKLGGVIRYEEQDLYRYLDAHKVTEIPRVS